MKVVLADVIELLVGELDLDDGEIDASSTMNDVENWDSLGHLRVCMALEARYGVQIPMERVPELTTVSAILGMLESA